ncbi:cyclopropane-fatty-acyl-phospholipid synthase [Sinisalibacter aestuarii]|uniref:Cyclopropane-fatty-acyl-phospholipid synthase n=1 Tax=Sinisalibacter aestuarii TaxID=2949426 RepID=A0ABQ5LPX9_9RHOB|nr:cyclopropane-fatty-acyl-phospholipid synthase [Sinisalibacter aestuarii]
MPNGTCIRAGDNTGEPVVVRIENEKFVRRLLLDPDMALGEGYMNGDLTVAGDDIYGLLDLAIRNISLGHSNWLRRNLLRSRVALRRFAQHNPIRRAHRNVAHHYDLSGELYSLFLDADRQYSCAYFRSPDVTLEQAQKDKKAHIARKLLIEPGMSVLDIGCGWGGMGLTLAEDHGATVTGVTLSAEQHKVACARASAAGLQDRVAFRLEDYRDVRETFDRIVSVGMFEHVGVPHYREFFRNLRERLSDDGVALLHTIGRSDRPGITNPWIAKYIFPGGYCPAMSEVMKAIEKEGLIVTDVEVLRIHYAETLRHWRDRFEANIDRVREIYDDRFCRMWRFYLIGSELSFRHDDQVVFQIQLTKNLNAAPITRDYMTANDRAT